MTLKFGSEPQVGNANGTNHWLQNRGDISAALFSNDHYGAIARLMWTPDNQWQVWGGVQNPIEAGGKDYPAGNLLRREVPSDDCSKTSRPQADKREG